MLNVLVLSTSTNNVFTFIGSFDGIANVSTLFYDQKWQQVAQEMVRADPSALPRFQAGQQHIPRDRCAMDAEMLLEAKIAEPDLIVYISAWQGDFVPLNETLGELNQIAPVVHLLNDGGDHPWWPQLAEFERRGTFSLTVNIDGAQYWPGGPTWDSNGFTPVGVNVFDSGHRGSVMQNSMTLLTPVDVSQFPAVSHAYRERPYAIGYAGNNSGMFRSAIVQRLQGIRGFAFKERDQSAQSYGQYAAFLQHTRVSVSVPFTGSGKARHVKGRVLESGFAGACLLEWANAATRAWFTPRHEYWEYESVEECAELAEWLAAHPKIAEATAQALTDRLWKEHAPKVFWRTVFERLGK